MKTQYMKFADLYFANGGNGYEAAKNAGFAEVSARQYAMKLLEREDITLYLNQKREALAAKASITIEDLLIEYKAILYNDPIYLFGEDGMPLKMRQIPPSVRRCIASFDMDIMGNLSSIKFWNKNKAMDEIMKHLGGYDLDNEQKKPLIINNTQIVFK